MKAFISKNFLPFLSIALMVVILLKQCNKVQPINTTTIVRDTVMVIHDSVVTTLPTLVKTIPVNSKEIEVKYIPDTNYKNLLTQYWKLVDDYMAKNIYKDSLKVDSIGFISFTDTVTSNSLKGRKIAYNFKYPTITNTVTIYPPNKRQVYLGGGIGGNAVDFVNSVNVGAIYKDKKQGIVSLNVSLDRNFNWGYSVGKYWLIKIKK